MQIKVSSSQLKLNNDVGSQKNDEKSIIEIKDWVDSYNEHICRNLSGQTTFKRILWDHEDAKIVNKYGEWSRSEMFINGGKIMLQSHLH